MSLYPMPAHDVKRNTQRTTPSRASRGETLTQLVTQAQNGDMRSFDALVARFQDRTVGKSAAILGDAFTAQDVAQEAFTEAYRRLPELKIPAAFPSLLDALIRKHCDRVTRQRRLVTVSLGEALEIAGTLPTDASADPARRVVAEAQRESVREAVRALPDAEREIILLFYVGGQSHKEIAAALNLSVSTVKSRLHEGRTRLKRRMAPMLEETLSVEQPSRSQTLRTDVANVAPLTSLVTMYENTQYPTYERLERERKEIEARVAAGETLDIDFVLGGAELLLYRFADYLAAAELMERYLAQSNLTPSQQAWAKRFQLFCLSEGWGRPSFVMRHREFLLWLSQQSVLGNIHLADGSDNAHPRGFPVAPDAPDRMADDCLMLWGLDIGAFNLIWRNIGRTEEWLALARETLAEAPRNAASRLYRYNLLYSMLILLLPQNRQEEYLATLEEMENLADEAEAEEGDWETPLWRIFAAKNRACALIFKPERETTVVLPDSPAWKAIEQVISLTETWNMKINTEKGSSQLSGLSLEWKKKNAIAEARIYCAYLLRESGQHERAILLFRQVLDAGFGGFHLRFACAASLWQAHHDREEALAMLRCAAQSGVTNSAMEEFQKEKDFADVHNDPEFLAAVGGDNQ